MSAHDGIFNHLTGRSLCPPPRPVEEAAGLLSDHRAEVLREMAAKVREVGTAKGWSVWAAAFMDPDAEFVDTGMPSTESIVAELRRLDRAEVLREAADKLALEMGAEAAGAGPGFLLALRLAVRSMRRMAAEVGESRG